MLREKYCQQNRANEPEKLKNKLLIGLTDYAKVKKIKNKNGCNNNQTMTSTLFSHLNEQGYKFSMITTGISSHVRFLLEEKGVRLLSLSLLWSDLKNIQYWQFPTSQQLWLHSPIDGSVGRKQIASFIFGF